MNITDSNIENAFRSFIKTVLESINGDKKQEILGYFISILERMQDESE